MTRAAILLGALALAGCGTAPRAAGPHPLRLVSINPCVDAVLAEVAAPATIAGISHYSQDARATSVPLDWARRFHATSGTAEEVVALAPDVVLTGPHVEPATIAALNRMHIRVEQFAVPETPEESEAQVRVIAGIAQQPARGEALAQRIAVAARPSGLAAMPALMWQGGGLVPGAGTLADELLSRAGFRNLSASYGLKQWDVLPLEYLVASPPRVLLSVGADAAGDDRMTSHPALARLRRRIAIVTYPTRLMNCGGPTIVDAMARLRAIRRGVSA